MDTLPDIQHTILTAADAWGDVRRVEVEWMPEPYQNHLDMSDHVVLIGGTEAPVYLYQSKISGIVKMKERIWSHDGRAFQFTELADEATLQPGAYRILSDTYGDTF